MSADLVPGDLMPVGKDCECGHPLVWRLGEQRCAVYGRHLAPADLDPVAPIVDEFYIGARDRSAPGSALVDLCAATPAFRDEAEVARCREYARHARTEARRRREKAVTAA